MSNTETIHNASRELMKMPKNIELSIFLRSVKVRYGLSDKDLLEARLKALDMLGDIRVNKIRNVAPELVRPTEIAVGGVRFMVFIAKVAVSMSHQSDKK